MLVQTSAQSRMQNLDGTLVVCLTFRLLAQSVSDFMSTRLSAGRPD